MVKVAAIDCGSNSTRLLIANVSSGELTPIFKTHKVTKTSEGLENSNEISKDAKNRLIKVLREYLKKINSESVDHILITGTAVFRDAHNSEEVIEEIRKKLDLEIQVISGDEEGYLTSIGVLSASSIKKHFFIVDIGGRSTELIYDADNRTNVHSLDIGVVSLTERISNINPFSESDKEKAEILINQNLNREIDTHESFMIGVAGTFTSIASIYLEQKIYDEDEIHLTNLTYSWITDLSSQLNLMTEAQIISKYISLDPKRAKTLSPGVLIVCNIMKKFNFDELKVSKSDILEGLILKNY
jgi:exopolyphosphatase/guanosine-5'-triphosphate,3'-diphosphate pyrophosphatase|tara:strand:+ start:6546 stop:7445 length:900 start_codon:yes stop_codon:yes gene_type:complete